METLFQSPLPEILMMGEFLQCTLTEFSLEYLIQLSFGSSNLTCNELFSLNYVYRKANKYSRFAGGVSGISMAFSKTGSGKSGRERFNVAAKLEGRPSHQ